MTEAAARIIELTRAKWAQEDSEARMTTFLNDDELAELTGCKRKQKQIDQLKRMGLPFYVNASGRAVVVRSVVEGMKAKPEPEKRGWMPRVVPA